MTQIEKTVDILKKNSKNIILTWGVSSRHHALSQLLLNLSMANCYPLCKNASKEMKIAGICEYVCEGLPWDFVYVYDES